MPLGPGRQPPAGVNRALAGKALAAAPLLDSSQIVCKNDGECIGYQDRDGAKTCSSLFLCDDTGLACSWPLAGHHNDLFEIEQVFHQLLELLEETGLEAEGLFLNADASFNSQEFRGLCSVLKIEANIATNPRNGRGIRVL